MSQDNKGSDLSDLKSRLGLNKGEEDESESDGDPSGQGADGDQQAAQQQGGQASGAEETRYQAQQQGQAPGQQPAQGGPQNQGLQGAGPPQGGNAGPSGAAADETAQSAQQGASNQVSHEAETRVGPPPGEEFPPAESAPPGEQGGPPQGGPAQTGGPPGQGGAGVGDQSSSPQQGGLGDQPSSPQQGGPSLGEQGSNAFSETTPDDNARGPGSFGPPGGGPPGGAGPPDDDHDPTTPTSGAGDGFSDTGSPAAGSAHADPGADVDLDSDDDFGLDESTFSTPVLVMLGVVFVVGLVFGLLVMSSMQQRNLYSMQTDQAKEVLGTVEPKAKAFKKAKNIIEGLNPEKVEYDKAKQLAELDVAIDMSVLSSNKLFLGGSRMAMLTSYLVKAEKLEQMLEEHNRLTNQVEKKALKEVMGGKEGEQKKAESYAAVFNFNRYKNAITRKGYEPMSGKIVSLKEPDKIEDRKVKYSLPNSERVGKIDVRGVIRIPKGELTVGGETAFDRYQNRVNRMRLLVKKMSGRADSLVQKLKELAERPGPPLISL